MVEGEGGLVMAKDLDQLLEDTSVHAPGQWENTEGPLNWWAVSTERAGGIVAYFQKEEHAFGFRLWLINGILNPVD